MKNSKTQPVSECEQRSSPRLKVARGTRVAPSGLLLVDKPQGVTSHDVVNAVRRLAATRKVGHAGTLDPMATGLMVVGIGKATRLLNYLQGHTKSYLATIRLGETTTTEDADGDLITCCSVPQDLEFRQKILEAMQDLTGEIWQRPSSVSAKKIAGKKAYDIVRNGKTVDLKPVKVKVTEFELLQVETVTGIDAIPILDLRVRVEVSAGTYVRALARDLGKIIGVGAHLTALRRTRAGKFDISQAHTVEQIEACILEEFTEQNGRFHPLPVKNLYSVCQSIFPIIEVNSCVAQALKHGQFLSITLKDQQPDEHMQTGMFSTDGSHFSLDSKMCSGQILAAVQSKTQNVVAIVEYEETKLKPKLVFEAN